LTTLITEIEITNLARAYTYLSMYQNWFGSDQSFRRDEVA